MALCSVIIDNGRLFSVGAGAPARLLLGCLTRRAVRVLWKTNKNRRLNSHSKTRTFTHVASNDTYKTTI